MAVFSLVLWDKLLKVAGDRNGISTCKVFVKYYSGHTVMLSDYRQIENR